MTTPSYSFADVLGRLITEEFGSRKAFAARTGVSEQQLSSLMSGARAVSVSMLQRKLLPSFPKLHQQQELWESYVASFVPAPATQQAPRSTDSDTAIERYLSSTYYLSQSAAGLSVFLTTRELWTGLMKQARHGLALRAAHAFVSSSFSLDRKPEGLRIARQMIPVAQANNEPALLARGLWLEAQAMPATAATSAIARTHREFARYVHHWSARPSERPVKEELAHMALRDMVVFLTHCVKDQKVRRETLERALTSFQEALARLSDEQQFGIGKMVEASAYVALGDPLLAEDSLETAQAARIDRPRQQLKLMMVQAEILLASRQLDRAWNVCVKALDVADHTNYVHGHNILRSIMEAVETSPPRPEGVSRTK